MAHRTLQPPPLAQRNGMGSDPGHQPAFTRGFAFKAGVRAGVRAWDLLSLKRTHNMMMNRPPFEVVEDKNSKKLQIMNPETGDREDQSTLIKYEGCRMPIPPSGYWWMMMQALGHFSQREYKNLHILMIGLGGGAMLNAMASLNLSVAEIVVLELDPEIEKVWRENFKKDLPQTFANKIRVLIRNGVTYVENEDTERQFDVIFVDAFAGEGNIPEFMSDHFLDQVIKRRRRDGVVSLNIHNDGTGSGPIYTYCKTKGLSCCSSEDTTNIVVHIGMPESELKESHRYIMTKFRADPIGTSARATYEHSMHGSWARSARGNYTTS